MKIFIKDFLSKSLMENFIFCAVSTIRLIKDLQMSNFSDNLLACYAYAVIFICRFVEGHVRIFPLAIFLTVTFPLFRSGIYILGHCYMFFTFYFLFFCK